MSEVKYTKWDLLFARVWIIAIISLTIKEFTLNSNAWYEPIIKAALIAACFFNMIEYYEIYKKKQSQQ